ncbi:hypothetical protein LN040_10530 [Desulfovibrio subterraneus]|uniref:hypothetical protein n=1 Tax=Desulfovibrio subterraneus TaxID=2718620 RepID=UPI0022B8CBB3|nr:hypothetical protein [Desulfovibrio subterraneus]WBF66163.1 hypothetical protein LN040_10530 [Desulfovibrio subterraneus]
MTHPSRQAVALKQLDRYWPQGEEHIAKLPVPSLPVPHQETLPPRLVSIVLPEWAESISTQHGILVPEHCTSAACVWEDTDWLGAAFWYINCIAEQAEEEISGPIHSYSFKLKGWDPRHWENAWANRIALFLRRWAAHIQQQDETQLFGPLPEPEIIITHDVDAVEITLPIRLKQLAFCGFNTLRALASGDMHRAMNRMKQGLRFLSFGRQHQFLDEVAQLESRFGLNSVFLFSGSPAPSLFRTPTSWVFDPAYDCRTDRVKEAILRILDRNEAGVHPAFSSWNNAQMIADERTAVTQATGQPPRFIRQHWLRFSFEKTWSIQAQAGFETDLTLGFNDRQGFRNGAALSVRPWSSTEDRQHTISSVPLTLMDSHLYDYSDLEPQERMARISAIIREVRSVHGVASVLWHPHTIGKEYGWKDGFLELLETIAAR